MRVFVTGSTGFVGTAVVAELLSAGHTVVGLTRSDKGVAQLQAKYPEGCGVEALRGTLEDLALLRQTAAASDAVLHLAYNHDNLGSQYAEACATDRAAIAALAEGLEGTDKPLVVTSATGLLPAGVVGTEDTEPDATHPWSGQRARAETLCRDLAAEKGVRAMVVRLSPTTHGPGTSGFMSILVGTALQKGASAYVGEGECLGKAGAVYHAAAEEAVTLKDLATAVGEKLGLPVISISPDEVPAHFGWFAFAGVDHRASSVKTREELGWNPTSPTVVEDTGVIVDYIKAHGNPF
ncbi:NAD dependent epimerase/dehydratase family protein [Apiospora arundinis]